MIKDQWYVILKSNEVKRNKPVGVTRFGEKLVLWRDNNGEVNCIVDKCIHRGVSLCKGHIVNGVIECPFHGFQYSGDGKCVLIPGNGKKAPVPKHFVAKSYKTTESYGFIWAFFGNPSNAPEKVPFFDDLAMGFTYATFKNHWKVHYSRVIENQLDVVHVPFVHKTTIGKGNKTLVNGPLSFLEDNTLTIKAFNDLDNGQTPKTADQLKDIEHEQRLIFKFPNIWQNFITSKIRALIAFAPIDDENTMLYIRFYQNIIKIPGISHIFNGLGSIANYIIQNQDKRIVETQLPKKSSLVLGENLIPGDYPVVQYRIRRDELNK